jgi:hypothetical protein
VHIEPAVILIRAFDLGFVNVAAAVSTIPYTPPHICNVDSRMILPIVHVVLFVPGIVRPRFLRFAKGITRPHCNEAYRNWPRQPAFI